MSLLSINKFIKQLSFYKLLLFSVIIIFYLFPTNHHLCDSYDYAASVKFGVKLFAPHHLLYNYFNYLIYKFVYLFTQDINVFRLMEFINSTFSLFCIIILNVLLKLRNTNKTYVQLWTLFAACSFGFMRFSTEVETYIIPIFFSLVSTLYFYKYLYTEKYKFAFLTGLFASIACLFHQIHLFWGIGLFMGFLLTKNYKATFLYLLSTPSVLIVYAIVVFYIQKNPISLTNFLSFIANYYYSENADTSIGISNLTITIITFAKTFFQIHGSILTVLNIFKFSFIIIGVVAFLIIYSIFQIIRNSKLINNSFEFDKFSKTVLIIFILQLSFAFYSHGNSEFMVMLPFLISLFMNSSSSISIKGLRTFIIAMFIWNISFGILPNHYIDYQNNKELVKYIKQNPNTFFILKENYLLSSIYFYEYGIDSYNKIILNKYFEDKTMHKIIGNYYTDVLTKKTPYSRVEFTTKNDYSNLKFIKHIKWINNSMGGFYIDQVTPKYK